MTTPSRELYFVTVGFIFNFDYAATWKKTTRKMTSILRSKAVATVER